MQLALSFNDVLEAVDQLTLAEQESLVDILRRRLADKRRAELLQEVQSARQEYQRNQVQVATADDIFEELFS
jgi:hypothetical protein